MHKYHQHMSRYLLSQPPITVWYKLSENLPSKFFLDVVLSLFICYRRPTYDRSQKPVSSTFSIDLLTFIFYFLKVDSTNTSLGSFRRVLVPSDITPKFLQVAQRNTSLDKYPIKIILCFPSFNRSQNWNVWYSRRCSGLLVQIYSFPITQFIFF